MQARQVLRVLTSQKSGNQAGRQARFGPQLGPTQASVRPGPGAPVSLCRCRVTGAAQKLVGVGGGDSKGGDCDVGVK